MFCRANDLGQVSLHCPYVLLGFGRLRAEVQSALLSHAPTERSNASLLANRNKEDDLLRSVAPHRNQPPLTHKKSESCSDNVAKYGSF